MPPKEKDEDSPTPPMLGWVRRWYPTTWRSLSTIALPTLPTLTRRHLLAALLLLVLASLVPWVIVRAYPGSFAYHCLRIAAGWLGYGWCHPVVVPQATYTFPPPQSSAIHWEGEGQFWENFPCNRSSYRVWLPEGPPPPPSPQSCTSTLVTAFFDIHREAWPFISRKLTTYLRNAKVVQSLRNPMVVLTSPEFAERVVAARREAGLMDRTLVVAASVQCAPQMWLLPDATKLMCSPDSVRGLWRFSPYLAVPERQEPVYNVLMWMKAGLMRAAATLPQAPFAAAPWVTWLDFGCHDPMCAAEELRGQCVDPAPWARPGRVRIAQTSTADDALMALGPMEWTRQHRVLFAGTVFGMPRVQARELMDGFLDTVQWLFTRGVADSDQTVFAWWWANRPGVLDAYPVSGDWRDIVRKYKGQAGKKEAEVEEAEARWGEGGLKKRQKTPAEREEEGKRREREEQEEEERLNRDISLARGRLKRGQLEGLYAPQ